MAVSKVELANGEILIDLTEDSVTPETLAEGVTAHDKSGAVIVGTMKASAEDLSAVLTEQEALIAELQDTLREKAAGGGDLSLPAGYRRVDYIRFNDAQIADTGIICNQNTKMQVCFTREDSRQKYLYGVASSGNTASVTAYLGGSWRFGNKSSTKTISTINEKIGYYAFVDSTTISVTDSVSAISDVNDFETVGTLLIGTCRSATGEVGEPQFIGKIFSFVMWEGDVLVRKLVPVTDGTVYRFWDEVSKVFFDSITNTPFEGGNL